MISCWLFIIGGLQNRDVWLKIDVGVGVVRSFQFVMFLMLLREVGLVCGLLRFGVAVIWF